MYSSFVIKTIDLVYESIDVPRKNLSCFGEGRIHSTYSTMQDYSVLSGKEAEYFVSLVNECRDIFDIDVNDYKARPTELTGIKYSHSCYPKNLRRWMKGTVSRKKKCRVEFVAIAVCWAMNWGDEGSTSKKCRRDLMKMCAEILGENVTEEIPTRKALAEYMWRACSKSYLNK